MLAAIAAGALLEQLIEVAAVIEDGDDPDLAWFDAMDDAVRHGDQLAIAGDAARAQLGDDPAAIRELGQRFDRGIELLVDGDGCLDAAPGAEVIGDPEQIFSSRL